MSRSGFYEADDCDRDSILAVGRTAGQVASAARGARGQAFLRMALKALDGMEDKRLSAGTFGVGHDGCMCFMSSIATETGRASVMTGMDTDDGPNMCDALAGAFNVAPVLVQDFVWTNDENAPHDPARRWQYMRDVVARSSKSTSTQGETEK